MNTLDLSQFDEMALIYNAGHAAFMSMYETRYPRPQPTALKRESVFIPIALCIMIIASVLVSGSRTVLEFGGGIVGVSAFVMLEGAIVTYAFFRTRLNFDDSRMESVRRLANRGLGLSFIVAVAANVHSVIKGAGIQTSPIITLIILILVAISAPTLAFISGDIMALELMRNSYKERKLEEAYRAAMEAWSNDLNTAWAREKSRIIGKSEPVQVEREKPSELIKFNQISSRNKPSPKLQKALDYFKEHPEHLETPSRELEVLIDGVSYGTINKAQVMIRSENVVQ